MYLFEFVEIEKYVNYTLQKLLQIMASDRKI